MDRGGWRAMVHWVTESWTRLRTHTSIILLMILQFSNNYGRDRKWQPTPVFLLGESQGRGSLVGYRLWARTESDTTEVI